MVELFANSIDSDQTSQIAVSDLGLHCLPITILVVQTTRDVRNELLIVLQLDIHVGHDKSQYIPV